MSNNLCDFFNTADTKLGVLCHVSSLPNKYGIGDFGKCCYDFIDFLASNGVDIWQILPLNNTNEWNCPYGVTSSLTFDEQYIDPDHLVTLGLIDKGELKILKKYKNTQRVKFDIVKKEKHRILNLAWKNIHGELQEKVWQFAKEHPEFHDYGYYKALQIIHNEWDWHKMPKELWKKGSKAYKEFADKYSKVIDKYVFFQYLLYTEWMLVRNYAKSRNVKILGDLPIYPDRTSLDVMFNLKYFKLDKDYMPALTGGVPPDDFCEEGQNWDSCIYDWDKLQKDGYSWIIKKLNVLQSYYDLLRIDHFAGFVEHFENNNADPSKSEWVKGGGVDLFNTIKEKCDLDRIVIEDLGIVRPEHKKVRSKFKLCGMNVLQFAFNKPNHEYLPQNVKKNSIYYLGTHDNNTYLGFLRTIPQEKKEKIFEYLNLPKMSDKKLVIESVKKLLASKSQTVVLQMQDYLMQNEKYKMNTPGKAEGSWEYRVPQNYKKTFTKNLRKFLK